MRGQDVGLAAEPLLDWDEEMAPARPPRHPLQLPCGTEELRKNRAREGGKRDLLPLFDRIWSDDTHRTREYAL